MDQKNKKPLKILQLRSEFSDNGPGSQTLTLSVELKSRGHNVIFCSSGGKLQEKIAREGFIQKIVPELAINRRSFFDVICAIRRVREALKTHQIDVVHTHNAASNVIAKIASLIAGMPNVKVFQSVRGVEVRPNYFWRNWIYKLPVFNGLFAVSQFTKNCLVSFGVPAKKIVVTYNGTNLERFNVKYKAAYRKEILDEFGLPEDAMIIGLIGRQDGNKGHRHLVKIMSELAPKYPKLYAILVGEGTELESNITLAKDLAISERVTFAGLRLDVEKFHAAFDVFTLLSKKGLEMFPNVIIEAMSYRNTFVATNTTGVPETAVNNAGLIVECEDEDEMKAAIEVLINDPEKRKEMGENAYQNVVREFNITEVVNKIENTYYRYI